MASFFSVLGFRKEKNQTDKNKFVGQEKEKKIVEKEPLTSKESAPLGNPPKGKKNLRKRKQRLKKPLLDIKYDPQIFSQKLESITKGLIYISETDAEILPFNGEKSKFVDSQILFMQIESDLESKVEEREFEDFFRHPIKMQDWFDEERVEMTKNYQTLKKLMEENLRDLKVFVIGRIEVDVYIIGLDPENNLKGIKTKAIET